MSSLIVHSFNHTKSQENTLNFNKHENRTHIQNTYDDINTVMDIALQNTEPNNLFQTVSGGFSYIIDMTKQGLNLLNASFKLYKHAEENWYDIFIYQSLN